MQAAKWAHRLNLWSSSMGCGTMLLANLAMLVAWTSRTGEWTQRRYPQREPQDAYCRLNLSPSLLHKHTSLTSRPALYARVPLRAAQGARQASRDAHHDCHLQPRRLLPRCRLLPLRAVCLARFSRSSEYTTIGSQSELAAIEGDITDRYLPSHSFVSWTQFYTLYCLPEALCLSLHVLIPIKLTIPNPKTLLRFEIPPQERDIEEVVVVAIEGRERVSICSREGAEPAEADEEGRGDATGSQRPDSGREVPH